jgi:hypothetical protein
MEVKEVFFFDGGKGDTIIYRECGRNGDTIQRICGVKVTGVVYLGILGMY